MPPKKRTNTGKQVAEAAGTRKRPVRQSNPHDILFEDPKHHQRYLNHVKRKLIPTRYICENTMNTLGIKTEIDRLFHSVGMLEFMYMEASSYDRLTLEFLSTIEFKLERKWNGSIKYFFGTLKFHMFNQAHELTVEELGGVLDLPIYGPGAVPDEFPGQQFWGDIIGLEAYVAASAKSSWIQNPCIRYAQKSLAYTVFGRGDSHGVATMRELFFLYAMLHHDVLNVAAFVADFLGKVGRASSGGISVGGLITQIAVHFGYRELLDTDTPIAGKTKIDMESLIHQSMITISNGGYWLTSRSGFLFELPDLAKASPFNRANWLYSNVAPEGDDQDVDFDAGNQGDGDNPTHQQFPPEPSHFDTYGSGASSMALNQWEWV